MISNSSNLGIGIRCLILLDICMGVGGYTQNGQAVVMDPFIKPTNQQGRDHDTVAIT